MILRYLRCLLFPFSLLYGLVMLIRNWAYDRGIFKSTSFQLPVIVVGNLAVGGAGKSPMTEYLVRLFKEQYKLAVLSRGYGRKTKGFRWVNKDDDATISGDEPLQFKQHFPELSVAVCESRVAGVQKLELDHELIILDDAYQHRALMPSFQIVLLDYHSLKRRDCVLPAGNLRESMAATNRADILVVTKSPKGLSHTEKLKIRKQLKPKAHQALFFSYLRYDSLKALQGEAERKLSSLKPKTAVFLLTGIANPKPMLNELATYTSTILHHDYPDHHPFTEKNVLTLAAAFQSSKAEDKLIITTEKDAQRLRSAKLLNVLQHLPVFSLPVTADFEEPDKEDFDHLLKQHVREYKKNH